MIEKASGPAGEGGAGVLQISRLKAPALSEFDAIAQALSARLGFTPSTARAVLGMLRSDVL